MTGATMGGERRGRPRSAAHDQAILDATLRLLARDGYARMSMDAIAAEAGVGKATIYLRYRSKADLATAALAHMREAGAPAPTGDLRRDLVAQLRQLRRNSERIGGMAIVGTCLTEERRTPELLELFRERTVLTRQRIVRDLLQDARARGELAPDADLDVAVTLLFGANHARHLAGQGYPEDWEERVVDAVLGGVRPSK